MKSSLILAVLLFAATASAQTSADVELTLTNLGQGNPKAGNGVAYRVHVRNLGPDAAAGTLTGSYPAGATTAAYGNCTVVPANCQPTFDLAAGQAQDFDLFLVLDAALDDGTTITTQINAVTSTSDPDIANNTASITETVNTSAELYLDIVSGRGVAAPGDPLDWVWNVTNLGPSVARDVVLLIDPGDIVSFESIDIDPIFTCNTPAPGASGPIRCTAPFFNLTSLRVAYTFRASETSGSVPTTIRISSSTPDPVATDNEFTSSLIVAQLGTSRVEMSGPSTIEEPTITDTLTITNDGPGDLGTLSIDFLVGNSAQYVTNFTVTQTGGAPFSCEYIPQPPYRPTVARCTVPQFANGATASFALQMFLAAAIPEGTQITAVAQVRRTFDRNPAWIYQVSTFAGAHGEADVAVQKSGPAVIRAGEIVPYEITISNAGPDAAPVAWSDPLVFLSLLSTEQVDGVPLTCSTKTDMNYFVNYRVECEGATLQPGESSTVRILVRTSPKPGEVAPRNVVTTKKTSVVDPNSVNDSSAVTSQVVSSSDLSIAISGPPTAHAGDRLTYRVSIAQNGPSESKTLKFTDVLPPGARLASIRAVGGNVAFDCGDALPGATGHVTCTLAGMQPRQTTIMEVEVETDPSSSGAVNNAVSITSGTDDPESSNNAAATTTHVESGDAAPTLDLAVSIASSPTALLGGQAVYDVTVTATGIGLAENVMLSDSVPAELKFASASPSQGTCGAEGGLIVCRLGMLAGGTTATVRLRFNTTAAGAFRNSVFVGASSGDSNMANNHSAADVTVVPGRRRSVR